MKHYPVFLGLVRPPMIFGVTQTFFALSFLPCCLFFIVTMKIFSAIIIYVIAHGIGMFCCARDPFIFNILRKRVERLNANYIFWGCNSYDPS